MKKKECSTCGGAGQIGYFQGESRFLLTWEECPRCSGTGSEPPAVGQGQTTGAGPGSGKKSGNARRKK